MHVDLNPHLTTAFFVSYSNARVHGNNCPIKCTFLGEREFALRANFSPQIGWATSVIASTTISCGQYLTKLAKCSQWVHTDPFALGLPLDRGDCLSKYIQQVGLILRELHKYRLCKQAPTCLITWLNKQWTAIGVCAHTHKHRGAHTQEQTHSLWRPPADYEAGLCLWPDLNLTISPGSFHCKGEMREIATL